MYEDYDNPEKNKNLDTDKKEDNSTLIAVSGFISMILMFILGIMMPIMVLNSLGDTGQVHSTLIAYIILTVICVASSLYGGGGLMTVVYVLLNIVVISSPFFIIYALELNNDANHHRHYTLYKKVVFKHIWEQSYYGHVFMTVGLLVLGAYIVYAKFFKTSDDSGED